MQPFLPQTMPHTRAKPCVTVFGAEHLWRLCTHGGGATLNVREVTRLVGMLLEKAHMHCGSAPDVEVLIVRDGTMAVYNAEHMAASGPTNILSFPGACGGLGLDNSPASLIVSVDTVQREAILYRCQPDIYLLRVLAHGVGHLMGFDHGAEMDFFCSNILG